MFLYELVLDVWLDFDVEMVNVNPGEFHVEELNVLR